MADPNPVARTSLQKWSKINLKRQSENIETMVWKTRINCIISNQCMQAYTSNINKQLHLIY